MKKQTKYISLSIFLVVQILFLKFIANKPTFVENYYSNGIYPVISKFSRFFFGWMPFSIGDIFYLFLSLFILKKLFNFLWKKNKNYKTAFFKATAFLSIIYFFFHLFWGMNYYRTPLSKKLFKTTTDTVKQAELYAFTETLIIHINQLQTQITSNASNKVVNTYSLQQNKHISVESYALISQEFPFLAYKNPSVKYSLFSLPQAYMGFSGYINPFSNEAQVSYIHPKITNATTMLHEMAHQLGFAAENEANFIACITAIKSKDMYFKYTGYLMALRFCLNDVYKIDAEKHAEFKERLHVGILDNIQDIRAFYKRYKNPLEPLFKSMYSSFLKSNNQKHGIKSYSYMVSLLLEYEKQENSLLFVPSPL